MRILLSVCTLLLLAPGFAAAQSPTPPPEVELIEAGEGPHAALQHRFEAGVTQNLRIRMQSHMRTQFGSRERTQALPIVSMDVRFGPTEVTSAGHLRYAFEVSDVGTSGGENEQLNAQMEQQTRRLVGTTGTAELDARGNMVEFDVSPPEGTPAELQIQTEQLRQSFSYLLPRFPSQPVGVGARWRMIETHQVPNQQVQVATTYELVSRRGDRIELRVNTELLEGTDNPARLDVSGSRRIRFELGTLRVRGRAQTVTAARMVTPQGEELRMRMRMRTQVTPF